MSGIKLRNITKVVKATEEVPIRTTIPDGVDDSSTKKGIIYPGFEVQIAEEWQGEEIEGNNLWFKDRNGDFYWSGWFGEMEEKSLNAAIITSDSYNYNKEFEQVPHRYRAFKAENIKVVILDTGVQKSHDVFKNEIKNVFNAFDGSEDVIDPKGHGTHVAGIIGGRNNKIPNGFLGIAPSCDLSIGKITDSTDIYMIDELKKSLDWAINTIDADVINMSFYLFDDGSKIFEEDMEMMNLLKKAKDKKITLVAAAGENRMLLHQDKRGLQYPAGLLDTIKVGAITEDLYSLVNVQGETLVDYICPFEKIYSSYNDNGKYKKMMGDSMATATLSGVIALIIGLEGRLSIEKLKMILSDIASPLKTSAYIDQPLKIYKP